MATMERQREEANSSGYGYRAGHEPSAPPAPQEQSAARGRQHHPENLDFFLGDQYPPSQFDPRRARLQESKETLGQRMLGILAGVAQGLLRTSHTVLRLELRRGISYNGPAVRRPSSSGRQHRPGTLADQSGATVSTGGPFYGGQAKGFSDREWAAPAPVDDGYDDTGRTWMGGGARLKLMQVWDFPAVQVEQKHVLAQNNSALTNAEAVAHDKFHDKEPELVQSQAQQQVPWRGNLGFGANVDTDRGVVEPRMRVRGQHFALHLLPEPLLELRGKWPLFNTQLALDARYRVPLLSLPNLWDPSGDSGARLMVNLFNPLGTGVHLTPGGLEFDEHLLRVGEYTAIRVAAAVDFPRQFPLPEGVQPIKIRINRLALKTRIF